MSLKISDRLKKLYNTHFYRWVNKAQSALVEFKKQSITQNKSLLSPVIFIIAAVVAIFSSGLALISLISLFCSLLVLYFIVTKIFGINLDLDDVVRV